MTIIHNQKSIRLGNTINFPEECGRLTYTEKDIERAHNIGDVVWEPGLITLRECWDNIMQNLFSHLTSDHFEGKFLNVNSINFPFCANDFRVSGGVPARTTAIINHDHILKDSKRSDSFVDYRMDKIFHSHENTH